MAICGAIHAKAAGADTDFTKLTDVERAIFHAEIRAVLSSVPELLERHEPTPSLYEDDIASDLELIRRWSGTLFDATLPGIGPENAEQRIALFIGPGCAHCNRAKRELEALSSQYNFRVGFLDTDTHAELARIMGADTLPFYVFPKMMLRGHMPKSVLERYLANRTGQ
ncbi:thioredoxin family protein [Alisedimentitalea sp. MJ-SS2]|uniref:thioredoxin family protein n=1 Tax=Aliisedimentitalea sp. MJ-SS2 TaxID=3049795 RepID=UPI0029081A0A|nr:thioredoxin family protein [Alisedimentitalea sp. MJ-SS2]MDU8926445.1 thioredoxin family protein [Alisedimentitalea sp. MJ-SS2]